MLVQQHRRFDRSANQQKRKKKKIYAKRDDDLWQRKYDSESWFRAGQRTGLRQFSFHSSVNYYLFFIGAKLICRIRAWQYIPEAKKKNEKKKENYEEEK